MSRELFRNENMCQFLIEFINPSEVWENETYQPTSYIYFDTCTAFYKILVQACAEIKIWGKWPSTSLGFSHFLCYFRTLFGTFLAAEIDLLLGLLPVPKCLRKHHRDRQFLPWSGYKCSHSSFSLKFLYIFVHISSSIESVSSHTDLGITRYHE